MSKKKKLFLLVILITVSVYTIYKLFNDNKMNYIALGDSLAEGMNSYGEVGYGYTDFVADSLNNNNKLKFYTKEYTESDAKAEDLINKIVNDNNLKRELRESNLVTLSIGINDFLSYIDKDSLNIKEIITYKEIVEGIIPDIDNCVKEIKKYAKNKLIIVGYYNPIPFLFNTSEKELDELFSYIDDEYQKIAKRYNATYISNYQLFKKNSNFLPNPMDIHPNVLGYQKIAQEILEVINKNN